MGNAASLEVPIRRLYAAVAYYWGRNDDDDVYHWGEHWRVSHVVCSDDFVACFPPARRAAACADNAQWARQRSFMLSRERMFARMTLAEQRNDILVRLRECESGRVDELGNVIRGLEPDAFTGTLPADLVVALSRVQITQQEPGEYAFSIGLTRADDPASAVLLFFSCTTTPLDTAAPATFAYRRYVYRVITPNFRPQWLYDPDIYSSFVGQT